MSHPAMGAAHTRLQITAMIQLKDWWAAEPIDVEGSWMLADAAINPGRSGHAIARLFVIHAISSVIGDRRKPAVDGLVAASYLAALMAAEDAEAGPLTACLSAAQRQDTAALASALHEAARACVSHAPHAARSLAELGYAAALEVGAWQDAYWSASLLERLAILDECPPAAERWGYKAHIQLDRVQRALRAL